MKQKVIGRGGDQVAVLLYGTVRSLAGRGGAGRGERLLRLAPRLL